MATERSNTSTRAPKIRRLHVLPAKNGRWFVRITARNGRIVGDLSQTYADKREATRAARSMCAAQLVMASDRPAGVPAVAAGAAPGIVFLSDELQPVTR